MSSPSLFVFGPQTTWPSPEYLSQLRATLLLEPRLQELLSSIKGLQKLLQNLAQYDSQLVRIRGSEQVQKLQDWIDQGIFPFTSQVPPNIITMPLTIIIHLVQYTHYLENNPQGLTHAQLLEAAQIGGIQGFCIGLLSAITVGCAKTEHDLGKLGGVALRLAACIGAYVDMDSAIECGTSVIAVRWNSSGSQDLVTDALKAHHNSYISAIRDITDINITAPKASVSSITQQLSSQGITVKSTGLEGRCHSSTNQNALQKILHFCISQPEMSFPTADKLLAPVRSNSDAQVLASGPLHKFALQCALVDLANWHLTMATAAAPLSRTDDPIAISFGLVDCIPTSIPRESGLRIIKLKNAKLSSGRPGPGGDMDWLLPSGTVTPQVRKSPENLYPEHAIAVIGMACKFPGADSVEEFWELLSDGASMCQEMPAERFSTQGLRRSPDGKLKFWGNFVRDADAFDNKFFKKSSREAASMDPQQRSLLEVAYIAMESSGYFGNFSNTPTDIGVYLGACSNDYNDNVASHNPNAFSSLGTLRAFLSGRISHWFNWTGPSITYDTACSSSAVAIHSACKAIQSGECSQALAGGVSLYTNPNFYQNLAAASFLSPTGPTKPFDAKADGYCRGEGTGLVVLKKLSSALEDGDNVIGVITGSAVNQNQNCTYITVPHGSSQQGLYEKVASMANVKPNEVSYVEAHGTGTPVGDPIEFESIRKVFGGTTRNEVLNVASVKGNIGHLEGAAGIAALIKVCLMMQKKTIPVQANFHSLNPSIAALTEDKVDIPTTTRPWESDFKIACVNNYGAAGSNAAMIICEAPPSCPELQGQGLSSQSSLFSKYPLYISANSAASLSAYCSALLAEIQRLPLSATDDFVANLTFNLANKLNRTLPYTLSTTVSSLNHLTGILNNVVSGSSTLVTQVDARTRKPLVLCFGGQVNDFVGLDKTVFASSSILQLHLNHCDKILRAIGRPSLFPGIFQNVSITDVVELHAMLFSFQYACAKAWIDSRLQVDAVIGHSFGQLTALCISGSISIEDGLKLVCGRASLMQTCWGLERGSMISIEADINTVLSTISSVNALATGHNVEIACYNGSTSHVLVGTSKAIDNVEEFLSRSKTKYRRLNVTHGFHSLFTEPLLPGLTELSNGLTFDEPKIHLETCSIDHSWSSPTPQLIAEHTRSPVYFGQAVARLSQRLGPCTWLEAGSNSSITGMARRAIENTGTGDVFLPMNFRSNDGYGSLADTAVALWHGGYQVQFWPFHRSQKSEYMPINLPPYQFEKSRHWLEWRDSVDERPAKLEISRDIVAEPGLLLFVGFLGTDQRVAEFHVNPRSKEYALYVQGHAVLAEPLCPAPLYMELAARAANILEPNSDMLRQPCIEGLSIKAPLGIQVEQDICLILTKVDGKTSSWEFDFTSHKRGAASKKPGDPSHAIGAVILESPSQQIDADFRRYERLVDYQRLIDLRESVDVEAMQGSMIYKAFEKVVTYAPHYKGVRRIFSKGPQVTGTVTLPEHNSDLLNNTIMKPLALDNFFQIAGLQVNTLNDCDSGEVFVCTKVETIRMNRNFNSSESKSWDIYSSFSPVGEREIVNDIFVFDTKDKSLVMLGLGAHFTKVSISSLTKVLSRANRVKASASEGTSDAMQASSGKLHEQRTSQDVIEIMVDVKKKATKVIQNVGSTVADDVRQVLSKVSDLSPSDIKDDSTLEDLGIDSLMVMEVLSEVQSFFKIEIPSADWQTLETPKLLANYLSSRGCGGQIEHPSSDSSSSSSESVYSAMGAISTPESVDSYSAEYKLLGSQVLEPNLASLLGKSDTKEYAIPRKNLPSDQPAVIRNAQEAFEDTRHCYHQYTEQTGFAGFWKKVYPSQARLVLAYTVEAFQELGCKLSSLAAGDMLPPITYLPRHELLVKQLYAILEDASLVSLRGTEIIRTKNPVDFTPSAALFQSILTSYPQHADEHRLLHITGSKLAPCLNGTADPLQLLFRDKANKQLLADVYAKGPMYEAITKQLGDFLTKALDKTGQPGKFHILELGGGTGGTTGYIVDLLRRSGISFTYTFTDISSSLVAAARRRFADTKNMEFMVIDIEKIPQAQHLGKYHVVLSTNCIHATRNLTLSTTNIRQLLRPDGFVSVVEFTRNMFWFDLVFGLLDGWWLFEDGRKHVIADQWFWEKSMKSAGFKHVTWTDGAPEESQTLRIITAFAAAAESDSFKIRRKPTSKRSEPLIQTVQWKQAGNCKLMADIYLPSSDQVGVAKRPIALMVHGGGNVMFTRKEVNPKQIKLLLDSGFLPISIEYRFCPEVDILSGPMADVCDALRWARRGLPGIVLACPGLEVNEDKVVVVGWSTGGHLAMTTAFTAKQQGVKPPDAILAFYCPTNYESDWWQHPIYPIPAIQSADTPYDLLEGVQDEPIASHYPSTNKNFPGMLMSLEDPRWRFVLHMNWKAQMLPVLINGLPSKSRLQSTGESAESYYSLPMPTDEQIISISPFSQIMRGNYTTPTYLIHGTADDLIPWEHSQRVVDALAARGVDTGIEILEGVEHLFDTFSNKGWDEIQRAYGWLAGQIF
ncbi:hypothetical protein ACLOAV_000354 [Pseudogymnoascus australis]